MSQEDIDSVKKAMSLLAETESEFDQSEGASSMWKPPDGDYEVQLEALNIKPGQYGSYTTGDRNVKDEKPCVFMVPMVSVVEPEEYRGKKFSLGFFTNRTGHPTRPTQDIDRMKTVLCDLAGMDVSDWTTTSDMVERVTALCSTGQYKVKVERRKADSGRDFLNIYVNEFIGTLGNQPAEAEKAEASS